VLMLLEVLELVDFVRGLFVGMDSAITRLANGLKTCKHCLTFTHFFNASTAFSVISFDWHTSSHLTSLTSSN
jgi:hypothetical protein